MHLEEPPKLIQPRDHKAKIQIWTDLSVSDLDAIADCTSVEQIKGELIRIFRLNDYKDNIKSSILLDLYYYTIQFAKDNNFSHEQTSAFFSIVKRIHETCIETPFGNVEHCFRYLKGLILCHAVKRPPYSIDLFNPEDVRIITEYVINTYFRHFKMYKYVFTPLVRLDLSMTYPGIPPTPEPSEAEVEATSEVEKEEVQPEEANAMEESGKDEPKAEEQTTQTESVAASELRALIKQHLEAEIKKLRVSVEEQIKQTEMNITKQIEATEATPTGKGGRASAKGKKK